MAQLLRHICLCITLADCMKTALYLLTNARYLHIARAQTQFLANQWGCDVHLFVEDTDLTFVEPLPHARAHVHLNALYTRLPDNIPTSKKWPRIVFLRNYAPRFLSDYDKLLYIDLDIYSTKADPSLWSIELPYGLAAVADTANLFSAPYDTGLARNDWLDQIGVTTGKYFNSGVLLIDPANWDCERLERKLEGYFEQRSFNAIKSQDFLNYAYDEKWVELSPRWNFQPPLFEQHIKQLIDPVFLHFCDRVKPWFFPDKPGCSNQRIEYENLFKMMLKDIGVDPQDAADPSEYRIVLATRKRIRGMIANMGLRTSKERRQYKNWLHKRETLLPYLQEMLLTSAFADMTDPINLQADHIPNVYFDGRDIRIK